MPQLLTFIILCLVTYRITRFLLLDSMLETPRTRLYDWLNNPESPTARKLWFLELLTCPYCLSVWIAAAVTTYWSLLIAEWPGWAFPLIWLGVAAGALIPYHYIDSED